MADYSYDVAIVAAGILAVATAMERPTGAPA